MPFQFDSRVRYSEMGMDKRLTLVSLVDYFQDCSTFQSEDYGVGIDVLKERSRAWMVLSWQIEILRRPALGEKIVAQTWPYAFKAFFGYRNFALKDEAGEYLAKANSVWALIDTKTGHPTKTEPELISGYKLEPPLLMPEYSRKIRAPEGGAVKEAFPVGKLHIDTNGHVNNGQYIAMAEEYLPDGFETKLLRVEYRQQARLHDLIIPVVHEEENEVTVSLCGVSEEKQGADGISHECAGKTAAKGAEVPDKVYAVVVFAEQEADKE